MRALISCFWVVPMTHGLNWKSAATLGGTLTALLLSLPLAHWAITSTNLRGLGSEDNLIATLYLPAVSILGVMLCGFIVGAVGGVSDVAIGQASTVYELAASESSPWMLFTSGMLVGRDHISSMVYTLALSYTGAALPSLLVLAVASRPTEQILTGDVIATELLRSGVGALALILAVRLTTLIAALTVNERPPR
ncbi:YibE/F family protein [Corynebacterium cystitidis]|uniref:YibE/F family protein n=1 Tax=Corynebacterium cystitidis TaxID=35757 RepID=UPI00358DCDB1